MNNVWRLKEIPLDIGDIPTLQFISADICRFSVESSVRQLIEEQRSMENNGIEVQLPARVFFLDSSDSVDVINSVRYFLFNLLYHNNHPPHGNSVMIEKFEDNLRELQAFLCYTTKDEGNDKRLKELVKRIRDVMYEAVDITYTASLQADKGKSLSYSFRRAVNVVKEIEYVTVKVQRLQLCLADGWDEEESCYTDLRDLIDWKTDDEAYNFRLLQLISQHMNKMNSDLLEENPEMTKNLEIAGDKSSVRFLWRDFAVLTDVDGSSAENELNQDKISTIHVDYICDYCGIGPIVGVAYRCKDCTGYGEFGLCEECYSSGLVSDHPGLYNNQKHTSEHEFEILTSGIHPTRLNPCSTRSML